MIDPGQGWVTIANYRAGYEADLVIAVLDAAGIPAVRRGNDIVGLFGPGFEGPTARGVDVLVPAAAADDAREVLSFDADDEPPIDGSRPDDDDPW
jgi:hypothetical protein